MNYEQQTREAYRSGARATAYRERQTREWSWARIATRREQAVIRAILRAAGLPRNAWVLDVPCGTGILGPTLRGLACRVVAADIAIEMMALARAEYAGSTLRGFLQTDLLKLPFRAEAIDCVVVLGFMHRVPREVRRRALEELAAISRGLLIVSCSVDSPVQRLKERLLRALKPGYAPAPHKAPLADILADCEAAGLRLDGLRRPVPVLSSEVVLLLRKARTLQS